MSFNKCKPPCNNLVATVLIGIELSMVLGHPLIPLSSNNLPAPVVLISSSVLELQKNGTRQNVYACVWLLSIL